MRSLAGLLSQRGWSVTVVAPRVFAGSRAREREDKVEVRRFHSFLADKLLIEYPRAPVFRLAGYMAAGTWAAVTCVRRGKCSLIHAHWAVPAGLMALVAGKVCNVPVIVTVHGSDLLVIPKRSRLMHKLVRYVLNSADAVTSVAEHLTSEIVNMGVPQEKVLTFPMSVPTESFSADGPVPEDWPSGPVVFSNRSLYPIYDVDVIVRAAPAILEKVPEARILIAGEGPEKERVARLARELGVAERVEFLGEIPHHQMPRYLRGASVYVSTALSDGASVSLLEAMACGTLPVVADIPANREWIQEGENGLFFPIDDADALAAQVLRCLDDPAIRTRAREINVSLIHQRAQWNLNVGKLLELYEKVIAQR